MDLLGTHVPKLQVKFRTGRPTAECIAASDLYAEPMNKTAMKLRSAFCASNLSKNQTEAILQIFQWKYIPDGKSARLRRSQPKVISKLIGRSRRAAGRLWRYESYCHQSVRWAGSTRGTRCS